jgi:hypothetical protein
MTKIAEILEKCRDKNFVLQNKEFIREYFKQQKSLDHLKNEINGKRNYLILNILERIDFPINLLIPIFEKKYITQYMYASMFWLYKKSYIDIDLLKSIQEEFKIMKNYTKMFEDTENHFLMFKIENDRKLQKLIKEDYNMKSITNVKIERNYEGEYVFVLNVDSLFDLSEYHEYEFEDSKDVISRIKNEYSRFLLEDIDNEDIYNINRIRNKYHYTVNLYNKIDRILNNKISKIYNNIIQAKRKGCDIKLVSECSVLQLLSEVTFFRYELISFSDLYSVKNKTISYQNIFKENSGKRIVVFGEKERIPYSDKIWYLDIKYFNIFNKVDKSVIQV